MSKEVNWLLLRLMVSSGLPTLEFDEKRISVVLAMPALVLGVDAEPIGPEDGYEDRR
jgi:hypothetical protein